ncbi:MAG TPA: MarR family transcriptional regulator [Burkholderiales bacterium]|nr:MarR family transcriptional regulator [Burkholderiales bacterium]
MPSPARRAPLSSADYVRLASFRYALRRFLHFSESETARLGLTGQQYQAMLIVRCSAERAPVTINDLARELLIRHNSAVGLVDRLVAQGLLLRAHVPDDRRKVRLRLSAAGERVLARLVTVHRQKLRRIGPDIYRILGELTGAWRGGR